ncbi:MAG: biotin/lipoyl-containing protein [Myxococcota bacterium]
MATYTIRTDGHEYSVTVVDQPGGRALVTVDGETFEVESAGAPALATPAPPTASPPQAPVPAAPAPAASTPASAGSGTVVAPIPGKILSLKVKVGDVVRVHQVVLVLEAMKMENNVPSPVSGTVKEIAVSEGSEVNTGQTIMVIE